ncbi:MAG: glutathione S-transferase family protein [Myxococcota bacterium]
MGKLVEGVWRDQWYETKKTEGRFVRKESSFRSWITPDGAPGPTGDGGFAAEAGRYHLYIARACPWAHRATIFRRLKGLEDTIGLSVVHPDMGEHGWTFEAGDGVIPDPIHKAKYLHQVYTAADPTYTGRVTVPLLWDKKRSTIVSNESSEIIRMMNSAFDGLGAREGDYYPEPLRAEIDEVNARIYPTVNNGVYRCGFATSQAAYEEAFAELFDSLQWLEGRLSQQRYLVGHQLTEADVRLWTTLVRFDPVYVGHFKTNLKRIVDLPHLWGYTRDLYQRPAFRDTVNMAHIKGHYYRSHTTVNPTQIVPAGPHLDYEAPHHRASLE